MLIKSDSLDLAPATAPCGCGMNHDGSFKHGVQRRKFLWGAAAMGGAVAGLAGSGAKAQQMAGPSATPAPKRTRIDVHHHYTSPALRAMMVGRRTGQGGNIAWTLQKSLDAMDAAGIQTAIVSTSDPGVFFGDYDAARALARDCNEYQAKMVADNPGRFSFFVTVPMPDVKNTLAEIAYGLDTLKAAGVGFMTSYTTTGTQYLGDPAFTPVWEELNRRKATVFVHPVSSPGSSGVIPGVTDQTVDYGNETSRTVASLLFTGATTKFPDINFIFSHGGGTIPYLVTRFQRAYAASPQLAQLWPGGAVATIQRLYFDTAQVWNPYTLAALTKLMPPEHIMFGTDFPAGDTVATVKGLAASGLSQAAIQNIERGNALRLMPQLVKA